MARVRSDVAFGGCVCRWNDIQVISHIQFIVSRMCVFLSSITICEMCLQFSETRSYIQRKSSSRTTPDFPREDDNRHYQVFFYLHSRIICLRMR